MKRLIIGLLALNSIFFLSRLAFGEDRKPNKQDVMWACGLHNPSHKCLCPAMVAEVRDESIEKCAIAYGPGTKEYIACMGKIPSECDIVKHPDTKHAEHTCTRNCTMAVCRCHDGPMCVAPSLTEPQDQ